MGRSLMNFKNFLLRTITSSVFVVGLCPNLYAASSERIDKCAKYYGFANDNLRALSCVYGTPSPHPAPGFEHICDENWIDYCSIQESPAPVPQQGPLVSCSLTATGINTKAEQTEYLQQSCIYGECTPDGYGFVWYLTKQTMSSVDSPQVVFITQEFAKSPGQPSSKLVIGFNASRAFFDYAESSSDGVGVLNSEIAQINSQNVSVTLGELTSGIDRTIKVGLLAHDHSKSYVNANLHCEAK